MKSNPETERQVQIRAEMSTLLFDISSYKTSKLKKTDLPEDAKTYGLLITLLSSILVIIFGDNVEYGTLIFLGLFGMFLGSFVIFGSAFSLATRLSKGSRFLSKYIL